MALFQIGKKIYSDRLRDFNGEDLQQFFKMFKIKYWGVVDAETWKENEKAALADNGEIRAKYLTEGKEVFLVRTVDRHFLFFLTQEDLDESFMEKYRERVTEETRQIEAMAREMYSNSSSRRQRPVTLSASTSPSPEENGRAVHAAVEQRMPQFSTFFETTSRVNRPPRR